MGTNGKEISCERFPKTPEEKRNPRSEPFKTKIPLRRKFNFILYSCKKFPKIQITSQGCPWALSIRPKFPKSWYGNFRRKFPENLEIVEISRSEPENCSLLGTDNVRGQISEHIFAPNGDYCLYIYSYSSGRQLLSLRGIY